MQYAVTNDGFIYAFTNDLIKYAITNDVIKKKTNMPVQLPLNVMCLLVPGSDSYQSLKTVFNLI